MRFKRPVRGIHIGGFVDGGPLEPDEVAHAHLTGSQPKQYVGYICVRTKRELAGALFHELAHLASDSGHDDKWRTQMRRLGARIPAHNRRKKRPRS